MSELHLSQVIRISIYAKPFVLNRLEPGLQLQLFHQDRIIQPVLRHWFYQSPEPQLDVSGSFDMALGTHANGLDLPPVFTGEGLRDTPWHKSYENFIIDIVEN